MRGKPYPLIAPLFIATLVLATGAPPAAAALPDEIQVYLGDVLGDGERGLELHVNTTPSGQGPAYPQEVPTDHGLRVTPELSYGLGHQVDAGLYLPVAHGADGGTRLAGVKLRLKWLPLALTETRRHGWFAGANLELAHVAYRYDAARNGAELRPIVGLRSGRWLAAINPVLEWALGGEGRSGVPDFSPQFKLSRDLLPELAVGVEYYGEAGPVNELLPASRQSQILFLTVDRARGPLPFNIGVGRGLTGASDRWTVKAIFDLPA